jgi:hypothetical protein
MLPDMRLVEACEPELRCPTGEQKKANNGDKEIHLLELNKRALQLQPKIAGGRSLAPEVPQNGEA